MALPGSLTSLPKVDLPPAQRSYYDHLFKLADQDNDNYIGMKDADFFKKSDLSMVVLGEVWQVADVRKQGFITKDEFIFALLLISLAQQGKRPSIEVFCSGPVPLPPRLNDVPPFKPDISPQAPQQPTQPAQQPQQQQFISPQEKKQWYDLFRSTDTDNDGFITGQEARNLFSKSGLPMETLSQIWGLADLNHDQRLDITEFNIAMYLINARKRGLELPFGIPDALISSARLDVPPPSPGLPAVNSNSTAPGAPTNPGSMNKSEWIIQPAEKAKYDELFKSNDLDKDGYITGDQAKVLFSRCGLPLPDLSRIWLLSDLTQDHQLDRQEFAIAMFLINVRLRQKELPASLPEVLILSARDDNALSASGAIEPPKKIGPNYNAAEIFGDNPPTAPSPIGDSGSAFSDPRPFMSAPGVAAPSQMGQFSQIVTPPFMTTPAGSYSAPVPVNPVGGFASLGNPNVHIIAAPGAELDRARQNVANQERTKIELGQLISDMTAANKDVATMLVEERAQAEVLAGEIRDMEAQLEMQKNQGSLEGRARHTAFGGQEHEIPEGATRATAKGEG